MIPDEELMAFVDDELPADARARIAALIAGDPKLAARVEAQRALTRRLNRHFDPVLAEPVPAPFGRQGARRPAAGGPGPRRWHWQEWSAMAATLVLGILLGPFVLRTSQPLPFMSAGGRVVAIGRLESALMQRTSGAAEAPDATAIGLTFRDAEGNYCRTFAMNLGPAGLACREWGEWVVEVLARNPRARQAAGGDTYRQAGTAFPPAIRDAVEARRVGDALSADEEAAASARGWRR